MKAIIIFAIAVMLLVSCEKEQPTNLSATYDKYQIQNDSDWVEIFDIDTVNVCIHPEVYNGGKIANTEDKFYEYFKENLQYYKTTDSAKYPCFFNYTSPEIDFVKRDLILFYAMTGMVKKTERFVYYNESLNEYLYLIKIYTKYSPNTIRYDRGDGFVDLVTIPKINNTKIVIDTLWIWP